MNIEEVFEYNQHFVAMMIIINYAKLTNKEGQFEIHHIIPRCYFTKHNLPVDNSENNLVKLTVEQHRKVHKLAALCATEEMKPSLKYAAIAMNRDEQFGDKNPYFGCHHTDEWKKKMSEFQKRRIHTPEEIAKMSASKKGKPSTFKGKHHSAEAKQKMSEARKGRIPWNKGKHYGPLSDETKQKISETKKNKKG